MTGGVPVGRVHGQLGGAKMGGPPHVNGGQVQDVRQERAHLLGLGGEHDRVRSRNHADPSQPRLSRPGACARAVAAAMAAFGEASATLTWPSTNRTGMLMARQRRVARPCGPFVVHGPGALNDYPLGLYDVTVEIGVRVDREISLDRARRAARPRVRSEEPIALVVVLPTGPRPSRAGRTPPSSRSSRRAPCGVPSGSWRATVAPASPDPRSPPRALRRRRLGRRSTIGPRRTTARTSSATAISVTGRPGFRDGPTGAPTSWWPSRSRSG